MNKPPQDRALKSKDVNRPALPPRPAAVFHPTPNHSLLTPTRRRATTADILLKNYAPQGRTI
jgi:hypothetical protein